MDAGNPELVARRKGETLLSCRQIARILQVSGVLRLSASASKKTGRVRYFKGPLAMVSGDRNRLLSNPSRFRGRART